MAILVDMPAAVKRCLDNKGFRYKYDSEKNVIRYGLNIRSKLKNVRYLIGFYKYGFKVVVTPNISADKDNPMEMVKYLTMANYGLPIGNFEIDLRDGEIRYKVYVLCDDIQNLPDDMINCALTAPAATYERYGDGIAALAMGFSDADTEIKKAESDN